ncbi:MAG TPA: lactate utilization protein [Micropepsaceae bacterium]|nr:lactate utilization protein [Micropepsaceae bacterium]
MPGWTGDPLTGFIARAEASIAQPHRIASFADAPAKIADILRLTNAAPELHVPPESPLVHLPWHAAPAVTVSAAAPTGEQSALSAADFGIAETGTLVVFSGPNSRSSWHFRPGREFVLIERSRILPRLEDVIAQIEKLPGIPATINLVTGPSRTADIEQTIELGAHGPREIHILITG